MKNTQDAKSLIFQRFEHVEMLKKSDAFLVTQGQTIFHSSNGLSCHNTSRIK